MRRLATVLLLLVATAPGAVAATRPLQPIIDAAQPGSVLALEPGTYAGPVVIDKPLTIDGGGQATIDAGGKGTVVTLRTDGATLAGLRLVGSGESHNDIDSGVHIEGRNNVVRDNVIEDCLFGIDLQQSDGNVVKRNKISSKPFYMGVRGDAIRLWYSKNNQIVDNEARQTRDMVVWYSADNVIARNHVYGGRYGLHFMYSRYNLVEGNSFTGNSVGIFLMYSDDVVVRGNRVYAALGATGMGIGLKETSNTDITDNEILYCGTGIYLDISPYQPDTTNRLHRNTVAFSRIGVLFLNDWHGNLFADNKFVDNIRQVSVNTFAGATRNSWEGNFWDDYQGFDTDHDGVGDTPHAPRVYSDRIWMDVPPAAFFLGTPLLSLIDFMERLAPFSEPLLMLTDAKPRMRRDFEPSTRTAEARSADSDDEPKRIDPFGLHNPRVGTLK